MDSLLVVGHGGPTPFFDTSCCHYHSAQGFFHFLPFFLVSFRSLLSRNAEGLAFVPQSLNPEPQRTYFCLFWKYLFWNTFNFRSVLCFWLACFCLFFAFTTTHSSALTVLISWFVLKKKRKGRLKINHKHFLKQGAGFCYRKSLSLKLASNHTGCVLF